MEKIYRVQVNKHGMPNFATAQEVVRCKKCKHWTKWSDGEMFCGCLDGGIGSDADDYCSHGEREDE